MDTDNAGPSTKQLKVSSDAGPHLSRILAYLYTHPHAIYFRVASGPGGGLSMQERMPPLPDRGNLTQCWPHDWRFYDILQLWNLRVWVYLVSWVFYLF